MDKQQEEHLQHIKNEFHELCDIKYRKGVKEHGGKLEDYTVIELLDMAIDEAIDQVVYLVTARDKEEKRINYDREHLDCSPDCGPDVNNDEKWIHVRECEAYGTS